MSVHLAGMIDTAAATSERWNEGALGNLSEELVYANSSRLGFSVVM
jgi:hypothetical protein